MKITLDQAKRIIASVNALNASEAAREDCGSEYKELYAGLCTYDEAVEDADEEDATHLYIACESWSSGKDAQSIICGVLGRNVPSIEFGDGGRDDKSLMIELIR